MKSPALIAAIALLHAGTASAAEFKLPCLTQTEGLAVASVLVAEMSSTFARRCAAEFPQAAPVVTKRGAAFAARFTDDADRGWSSFRGKLLTAFAPQMDASVQGKLSDLMRGVFVTAMSGSIAKDVSAKGCAQAGTIFTALEPMSDGEVIGIADAFLRLGASENKSRNKEAPFEYCPDA